MKETLQREVRVATSRKVQPIRFRIGKWVVFVTVSILAWRAGIVWYWVGGATIVSVSVHLIWRWKTHNWTRAWGGWNDLEAGRGETTVPRRSNASAWR
jgi:hypothetical protein